MTPLLEHAIKETKALSDTEQDFVAALLLENIRDTKQNIRDTKHWEAQFAASKDVLRELFDEAMEEYQQGRTTAIGA